MPSMSTFPVPQLLGRDLEKWLYTLGPWLTGLLGYAYLIGSEQFIHGHVMQCNELLALAFRSCCTHKAVLGQEACFTLSHSTPASCCHDSCLLHVATLHACFMLSQCMPASCCQTSCLLCMVTIHACFMLSQCMPASRRHTSCLLHVVTMHACFTLPHFMLLASHAAGHRSSTEMSY